MAAYTLTTIRNLVQERLRLGWLIENQFLDALAATTFTSARYFGNTNMPANALTGNVAFRPQAATASNADDIRYITTLVPATGVVSVSRAWSDTTTTSETLEVWTNGVDPRIHFLDALNRAMKREFIPRLFALSHGSNLDYDMSKSGDTDFTDVLTPTTSAKAQTAAVTPFGLRSYNLVGNATNEGTQTATLTITKTVPITAYAIAAANIGTASLLPYDVTGSASFTSAGATTHSEQEPQFMRWIGTPPSTSTKAALRLLGTTNPSDISWNGAWFYKMDNLVCPFPTFVQENFQAVELFWAVPMGSNPTSANVWNAANIDWRPLTEGKDYTLVTLPSDANPNYVKFNSNEAYRWPIFVKAMVPASDLTTFALTESDSTTAPLNRLVPQVEIELIDRYLLAKNPAYWGPFRAKAYADYKMAAIPRIQKPISTPYNWRGAVSIRV